MAQQLPLIYLSRVGILQILSALFGEVVVLRAVWGEAVERRSSAYGRRSPSSAKMLRPKAHPVADESRQRRAALRVIDHQPRMATS
jgi:predicted nucleic acid-binding protein